MSNDALYTMDQMREYADNFHLSRMRVLVAEKEAYERHAPKPKLVAWVRFCSDGCFEGPIMDSDSRMDGVRRTSGAWTPLYDIAGTAP
jgi:hypothetical protein